MERQVVMKKVIRSCALFAAVQAVLILSVCAALGLTVVQLMEQRLLASVVCGFGFLLTVLLCLLWRYLELPEGKQMKRQRWMLSSLFLAASAVLLAVLIYVVRGISEMVIAVAIFGGVLVIANVSILYLLRSMEQRAKEDRDWALLHQQMEIQTGSILALEKSYRAQRQATHEFHNQLQTIHDLLARGAADEALSYVSQLQGMQTTRVFAVNTRHPILDAVLNQKYQKAKEADTEIQFRVNDLSGLTMETDALVVLFSNLLDNAIEGCLRLPAGRSIQCSIELTDSLYISIRNTAPPVAIRGSLIPTSKERPQEHGFGMMSVRRILDAAGAEYAFDYHDGWFQFVTEIPL